MSESAAVKRLDRARSGLAELGVEALLVSHLPNVRYLTGFSGSSGWLLLGADLAVFVTDGRYEEQAREELAADAGLELRVLRDGILSGLAEWTAREFGGSRVGFEAKHISYEDWSRLDEKAETVRWEAVSGLVENLRAVKDDDEIAAISKAADIASEALLATLPLVKPGVREAEVASELDYRMVQLGAEGPAFETIVASGSRTALPHAATSRRRIQAGELLLCDFGANWHGYCSDLTRTFALGEPTPRQTEVHAAVREAQREALSALRVGSSGTEVDAATRAAFERRALDEQFPHSTGHGLGLEVHEAPRLGRRSEEVLRARMVVTIEPGLYFPGWGGVRIEDDAVVTGDQPRLLANLERDRLEALPG
jgi:Xaa-Pro aminopeptidase